MFCVYKVYTPIHKINARFIINITNLFGKGVRGQRYVKDDKMKETNLVSPVSFLKEKPSRAIFLPVTVLKRQSMILQANRRLWYSFISIT